MPTDNTERLCSEIREKLTQTSTPPSKRTIYKVHSHLRKINETAYEPEAIAIGPYHHGKDNLKMMEEYKWRYLRSLHHRKNEKLEKYVSVIEQLEVEARECYAERICLGSSKFIKMLVLDGCFIIELVRKCHMPYLREKDDPIFHMGWIMNSLQRDLMLFENQIPFVVVCKLFDLIEVPNQHNRLIYLLLSFFNDLNPGKVYRDSRNTTSLEIKHLLHLVHKNCLPSCEKLDQLSQKEMHVSQKEKHDKKWQFIVSVTGLRKANVKFKKNKEGTLFDIGFKKGTICMAPLSIEDRTESFLRNLIAYEQYFQDVQYNFVTSYVKFLDCLINSSGDVEKLSRYEIIDNWLGDDEVVANMFNKLTDSVTCSVEQFIYAKVFGNVNDHCKQRRKAWIAKFWRDYLNSPWAAISIIVAVVLLLLTITQTVCSILQVV